ncbi:MAG: hypothetical protein ACLR56_10715 [Oscillospiraceae bacterium]
MKHNGEFLVTGLEWRLRAILPAPEHIVAHVGLESVERRRKAESSRARSVRVQGFVCSTPKQPMSI